MVPVLPGLGREYYPLVLVCFAAVMPLGLVEAVEEAFVYRGHVRFGEAGMFECSMEAVFAQHMTNANDVDGEQCRYRKKGEALAESRAVDAIAGL